MQIRDFDFSLPKELIAQHPSENRDKSRLLHYQQHCYTDYYFYQICDILRDDDILVFNNSKVIPSRITGYKNNSKISLTLIAFQDHNNGCIVSLLAKPGKKCKIGDEILLDGKEDDDKITLHIHKKADDGIITAIYHGKKQTLIDYLHHYGIMPLPPYIKRGQHDNHHIDKERYQTIYAQESGSVAAPTAGLHFSHDIMQQLEKRNITTEYVMLHVGMGTFAPIKNQDMTSHQLHHEYVSISQKTVETIYQAKKDKRRIIAIGTTTLRVLEGVCDKYGTLQAYTGDINIFIKPPFDFKIVDCLVTNFHLPQSTLFMLVSAFCGLDNMQALYHHAVTQQYRFFSYGDACFLER